MKILLGSHCFSPSTGGIETVSDLLASEFTALGHEVRVVTQTAGAGSFPFALIRQPGISELIRHVKWCDAYLQNNISLRTLWPLLWVRRPLFIAHQTWLGDPAGFAGWAIRLKGAVLRHATNLSISHAIAQRLPVPSITVGNPYDDATFVQSAKEDRPTDLIFVGRLVSDKGVSDLLQALAITRQSGASARLTIVGEGPERAALEHQAKAAGLEQFVRFVGSKSGADLSNILSSHRILVVPSRWPEPFGIVALEGIACGCVAVGSEQGGLPEAIGPCGVTFPNGNAEALAEILRELLVNPSRLAEMRQQAPEHLARFSRRAVANRYLELMSAPR